MDAIVDDIELSNVEIAQALSHAAAIRSGEGSAPPWAQSEPSNLAEALTEALNLGVAVLGRDRPNPFDRSATQLVDVDQHAIGEVTRFAAAILVVADFICEAKPISSATIAFGVRSKVPDVVDAFVGAERSLMLLAGMMPLAASIEAGYDSTNERESAHRVALTALEWSLAEVCVLGQLRPSVTAAAA